MKYNSNSSHPVSLFKALLEDNITRKLLSLCLDALFKIVLSRLLSYILLYRYLFSLLSSGLFVIAVCGSISVREIVKYLESF